MGLAIRLNPHDNPVPRQTQPRTAPCRRAWRFLAASDHRWRRHRQHQRALAHRVAHLIVLGADPRRMMLLTFSRRAAVEMIRRVERIAAHVLPDQAWVAADALSWSG